MNKKKNAVYIATSLDGYIADKDGKVEWLESIQIPEGEDMGYVDFTNSIDALLMGRNTFETVLGFDVDWPYEKPVFVLSNSLIDIPKSHKGKAYLVKGALTEVLEEIHNKGCNRLYIDGGVTIQNFLKEDLIDELIVTIFPVVLGGGPQLFSELPEKLEFELVKTHLYADQLVQNHYKRRR